MRALPCQLLEGQCTLSEQTGRLSGWLRSELCLGIGVDVSRGVIQLVNLQAGSRGGQRQRRVKGERQQSTASPCSWQASCATCAQEAPACTAGPKHTAHPVLPLIPFFHPPSQPNLPNPPTLPCASLRTSSARRPDSPCCTTITQQKSKLESQPARAAHARCYPQAATKQFFCHVNSQCRCQLSAPASSPLPCPGSPSRGTWQSPRRRQHCRKKSPTSRHRGQPHRRRRGPAKRRCRAGEQAGNDFRKCGCGAGGTRGRQSKTISAPVTTRSSNHQHLHSALPSCLPAFSPTCLVQSS